MKGDEAGASLTSMKPGRRRRVFGPRPLQETVSDTLAWFQTLPADRQAKLQAGIAGQKESETLQAWHQGKG